MPDHLPPSLLTSEPDDGREPDKSGLRFALNELRIAVQTIADLRRNDLALLEDRHKQLVGRIDGFEQAIPSKTDLSTQLADLRQRVNDIQAMEASLREASLQTIRSSFQSEAAVVEKQLSLGSQQRYSALETKIDKAESSLQSKISDLKTSSEAQMKIMETNLQAKIAGVEQSLDAKIKGQVMQGIIWGMGIVGGIIGATMALLKYLSP